MILLIEAGTLYADNLVFCQAEVCHDHPAVSSSVEVRYSHHHGRLRVFADGLGWLGADTGDAVTLGRVRSRDGVLACRNAEGRLVSLVSRAEERGEAVSLNIKEVAQ